MSTSTDNSSDDASGDSGSSNSGSDSSGGSSSDGDRKKNVLEWIVFGLGLAITLGVIGYMGYQVVVGSNEPADVQVTVLETRQNGEFIIVPIEAENKGDQVAEAAMVEVCAGPDSCGEVTFSYIPKGSKRSGVIGLNAPLQAPITTRVVSFRKP